MKTKFGIAYEELLIQFELVTGISVKQALEFYKSEKRFPVGDEIADTNRYGVEDYLRAIRWQKLQLKEAGK